VGVHSAANKRRSVPNDAAKVQDSLYIAHRLRRISISEIAPGPGYLSIEIAERKKYRITALEISQRPEA
jgi:hypothetical protein